MRNILKKQGGFTLLELLIVIVIIGILALLIVPNVVSAPKKSRDAKRKTDLKAIRDKVEEYFVDNGAYPATLGDVTGFTAPDDPKNVSPHVYTYTPANSNTTYTLTACLENANDSQGSAPVAPCTTKTFQMTNAQ